MVCFFLYICKKPDLKYLNITIMKKSFTLFVLLSALFGRLSSVSLRYSIFNIRYSKFLLPFIFSLLSFTFASAQGTLDSGLVAKYYFNGNANDESGNGNNGTVNGATLTTFGNANKAYSFDGVKNIFLRKYVYFCIKAYEL